MLQTIYPAILSGTYFTIISMTDNRCDLISNNTSHCWSIQYHPDRIKPVFLMHKHSVSHPYYHTQWMGYSSKKALQMILSHDAWVLKQERSEVQKRCHR